ncbi:UDP-N-acetylglucosamine 4,6-dehydratase (inverting) [Gemmatimonadota bacterium]
MNWSESSVLLTGGTGSFGKKFTEILLSEYKPKKLTILSRDELKQHEMRTRGFDQSNLRYFIGDVRDVDRLRRAFMDVDIVIHAAALKQVPACEYNPIEAIATNIDGARNVIDAAIDLGVSRTLALSTDKATAPLNLYGATKLVAEKLFVQANAYRGSRDIRFSTVRYGNVVGSRGSVVPLFREQRESGKLTITDDRMTRFWITLEQGVRFVISCLEQMQGGEVFVPKLPSVNIMELARVMAPECTHEIIGIRPGEKVHECLISTDEARQTIMYEDRYVILPTHPWWGSSDYSDGEPLPEGFTYASDLNDIHLSENELREMIDDGSAGD